jgi:hypothetical protein
MLTRLLIEAFGSHVDPVRPNNRPCFRVDSDLGEVSRVTEGFKNTLPFSGREVDITDGAVVEKEAESVVAYDRDAHDSG